MNPQEIIAEILEHIRGMWRFRWWAVGVAWLISVFGWGYVYSRPDVFQASTRMFVDTNSLLRPLMAGLTAQQNPLDEVQLVSTAVLSRPNLEAVANETDLALQARTPQQLENLVTGLQQRIRIRGGRDNIFTIDYEDTSRERSVAVVAALYETFVDNALGNQGNDAEVTERALASEIKEHEERLNAADAALAQFKRENLGFMPGEGGDYYERLQGVLADQERSEEQLRLLIERRQELNRQIVGEEPVFGAMIMAGPMEPTSTATCSLGGQIAQLQGQLATLRVDFTEKHPRIVTIEESIAALQQRCSEEAAAAQAAGVSVTPSGPEPLDANPVYQNLRIQLSSTEVEIVSLRAEIQARREEAATLQANVDKIVKVETDLKQLNRDYDVVAARHQELLRRWEDLQAKKRLDPVTDRVQFRPIDPPFALADPVGPNRPLLLGGVFVFALAGGVAAAFAFNQLNPAFFTVRSLRRAVDLPVLGAISMIGGPEMKFWRRADGLAWAGANLMLLIGTGIVIAFARPASMMFRDVLEYLAV